MHEVHSISFDSREVIAAALAHRKPVIKPIAADTAVTIGYRTDTAGRITASLVIGRGPQTWETLAIDHIELTVALVEYCMALGVPIKKVSNKWIALVDQRLSLFVAPATSSPDPRAPPPHRPGSAKALFDHL